MVIELQNFGHENRKLVRKALAEHPDLKKPDNPKFVASSTLGMSNESTQIIHVYEKDENRLNRARTAIDSLEIGTLTGVPCIIIYMRAHEIDHSLPASKEKTEKIRTPV